MPRSTRGAAALGLCLGLGLAAPGCSRDPSQIVIGVLTNLRATEDMDRVRLDVKRDGVPLFFHDWDISGSPELPYELPGSFVVFSDGNEPLIEVAVIGYADDRELLRRTSRFSILRQQTRFVRMALVQRCVPARCPAGQTCIEDRCAPVPVSAETFPVYQKGMELQVACDSGSGFQNTSTKAPLQARGACAAGERCVEGTCYQDRDDAPGGSLGASGAADMTAAADQSSPMDEDLRGADLQGADLSRPDLSQPLDALMTLDASTGGKDGALDTLDLGALRQRR